MACRSPDGAAAALLRDGVYRGFAGASAGFTELMVVCNATFVARVDRSQGTICPTRSGQTYLGQAPGAKRRYRNEIRPRGTIRCECREVRTSRIRRGWLDRLRGYDRLYETTVTDGKRIARGKGFNREASETAALRNWNALIRSQSLSKRRFIQPGSVGASLHPTPWRLAVGEIIARTL